jgi:hypothetical protein
VKYALSGIAKCAHCGAILAARTRVYGGGKERVKVRRRPHARRQASGLADQRRHRPRIAR